MSFSVDIAKFVRKANGNADAVTRRTVLDIGTRLIERTPVGDATYWQSKPPPGYVGGHARANWQHSVGAPVVSEVPGIDADGTVTVGKIATSIPAKAAGLVHFIANSVPYIIPLEEGHSRQAPFGMVSLTVVEFGGIVNAAAQAVNK